MKYLKIFVLSFLILCPPALAYFYGLHVKDSRRVDSVVVEEPEIKDIPVTMRYRNTVGDSMYPAIKEGDVLREYKLEPKVGDIVGLKCLKPECITENSPGGDIGKRLIKVREDGAWWIEGDNKAVSYDSRHYGWVLPSERTEIWVIKVN